MEISIRDVYVYESDIGLKIRSQLIIWTAVEIETNQMRIFVKWCGAGKRFVLISSEHMGLRLIHLIKYFIRKFHKG